MKQILTNRTLQKLKAAWMFKSLKMYVERKLTSKEYALNILTVTWLSLMKEPGSYWIVSCLWSCCTETVLYLTTQSKETLSVASFKLAYSTFTFVRADVCCMLKVSVQTSEKKQESKEKIKVFAWSCPALFPWDRLPDPELDYPAFTAVFLSPPHL